MAFNYQEWIRLFLEHGRTHVAPYNDTSGVTANGVDLSIKVKPSLAKVRYRVIGIHHLTKYENLDKQNLYMAILDEAGQLTPNLWVGWGWEGQRPGENSPPVRLDKPVSEPPGNIPIWNSGQHIFAHVNGQNAGSSDASDEVSNARTDWPDDKPGNSIGHHSFFVVWQRTTGSPTPEPEPEPQPPQPGDKVKVWTFPIAQAPGIRVKLVVEVEKW